MAWKNWTGEQRLARRILESKFYNGRRLKNGKPNSLYSIITVALVAFGFVWTCGSPKDKSEGDKEEGKPVAQSAETEDAYGESYSLVADGQTYSIPETSSTTLETSGSGRFTVPSVERVTIERCVDGDTLIVITSTGERERVRLIGANTPETVKANSPVEPYGPEASAYTKMRVEETGNVATLVADGSTYDKYNRRLAFVYLGDEQFSLNEDLCRQGLAKAETQYSFSKEMKLRLTQAADVARSEGLGIYSLAE